MTDNTFLTPIYESLETLVYAGSGGRDVLLTVIDCKILFHDCDYKTVEAKKIVSYVADAAKRIRKHIFV